MLFFSRIKKKKLREERDRVDFRKTRFSETGGGSKSSNFDPKTSFKKFKS